jgi:hypothetical protein
MLFVEVTRMDWERIEVPGAWYEEASPKAAGYGRHVWRDETPPEECPHNFVLYELNEWRMESFSYWVTFDLEGRRWVAEPKKGDEVGLEWERELERDG